MDEEVFGQYEELHRRIAEGPQRKALDRAMRDSIAARVPLVPPSVACLLFTLVRARSPQHILEVGAGLGYSAAILALASPGAELTTIEVDRLSCEGATRLFATLNIADRTRLLHGTATHWLSEPTTPCDFAFLDADKEQYPAYLDLLTPRLLSGSLLVADDVYFTGDTPWGSLPEPQKTLCVEALTRFRKQLRENPRFLTSLLSIGCGVSITMATRDPEPHNE